jgi:hypothetical protein
MYQVAANRGLAISGGVAKPQKVTWGRKSIEQLCSLVAHISPYVPTR